LENAPIQRSGLASQRVQEVVEGDTENCSPLSLPVEYDFAVRERVRKEKDKVNY
jgi:hypothetical protein